jgi:spermidine synthase
VADNEGDIDGDQEKGRSGTPLRPGSARVWPSAGDADGRRGSSAVLLTLVLVIATAGLVYELSIAAVASYLLGDSIREFSLILGAYLSALGLGAHLSRHVGTRLALAFVEFRELVARALTFDYAGALVGSMAFSLVLVPGLGLAHTSVACGLLNAITGIAATWALPPSDANEARDLRRARLRGPVVVVILGAALALASRVVDFGEAQIHPGRIVVGRQSPYQRIVLTDHGGALELFLNENLQFSSRDEYRYHEALVHPAMAVAGSRRRVVVGGGGDGLAAREILRWPDVESVTVVDLDRAVTDLARSFPELVRLNRGALSDARVTVVNVDAMRFFSETEAKANVVVLDFPDPGTYSVGKLYTTTFYGRVRRSLAPGGAIAVQASSSLLANETFSCIVRTLEASGFFVRPYQAFVPSFGMWGFVLARTEPFAPLTELPPAPLRFLDAQVLASLFRTVPALSAEGADVNRLDNQALVPHYLDEWGRWEGR